jgi:hypothetical protein
MVEVSAWTTSFAFTSLFYYIFRTLRGVHLSVVLLSRYVLPLQKDANLKRHYIQVHGGTPLQALG